MGFSWAFWVVQQLHSYQARRALGVGPSRELTDHNPLPDLKLGPCLVTYCDNCNIAGTSKQAVQRDLERVVAHLSDLGLPVHEVEAASSSARSLGYRIDGEAGRVAPDPQRLHLVRQTWLTVRAIEW